MALSLERYRQLKADNKIGWNTEALESTGKNIKSFIDGVNGQRQMSGAQWTADEFGKQRQQLDSLRGQLRYMQSYADSLKGTDAARYGKLNESIKSMGAALDESENWFAQNRDEEKRKNDYKTKKTGDALRELVQGGTDAAQAAEKYGLDKDELEKDYKDVRAYQKQGLREDKYGSLGFDDLMGVLRSADSMGQRIYDEIRRDYGDGLRNAQDFDRNAVFRSRAEKYGLTQDEVKRIYETFEQNEGDKHYQSTALSDEDKAYVARRIIETGSVEELQELKKTLPKAQYFDGLRYQLNQAIEDKSEQRYYLDIAEQNPRVTKIMEDIAAIDAELPSLANHTGARTGHKGQFDNIMDAQAARASYLRELTAQGYDAEKMVRYYKRYKERTENEQNQQALREWTQQNPVTAALGSVASVPVNMVGSVGDVVKVAMARLEELAGGDGWYDPKGTANYTAQNIRGSVNEMIGDENHIGQLLYSTGMSMGDMLLAAAVNAVPVVGQAASNAMFFSSAGVGAANEVIQNGGDINQATAAMIAQGSAELIFERISLEKLEALATSDRVKNAKEYFVNVLKQAFTEGSEEFNTTLANTLTDALINGGNSAVEREIRQYTEQGMSRDEAKTKAWETWLRGVVDDAVGGALSGGVLGNFGSARSFNNYINNQLNLGGFAVTPEQMSALLGENKAASADAAAALVKENGVDAVLEAVKQNGEKQTRQTAEHFAQLREKGKLDEKDAAALLVKLAREQADTEMTDALAQLAGAETKTDYKARTAQAESYNSDYDLSGARIEDGKTQLDSSFGVSHPHGMAARGLNREQMTVLGVESSLEEYGRDDRTVTLRLSDGSVTDAAGVTLADFDFDRLLNLASGYDTIGARALLSNYESAKANGASLDAYQSAFDALYQAGADGVRFEKAAENPQLRTLSDMIGEQAARAAVEAGNADGEIMVQARQTLVRRVRVPGKRHLGQSRIGVEYGAKDVSNDTKALLNAFAEKIGKQIIFTDRLNADENGLYSGNVIYLNSNLEEHAIFAAALHEAMHNARVYDPEGFRHVQAFVVNYLTAEGKDVDALLGDIAARWGKDAATREVQMEELVCKTVEALAADSEALQRAIETKKNSGILKKVGDALRRIADRIMQYFKGDREQGQRGHNLQAQAFLDDAAALRQMAEMCSEAFENARENEREFGGKENAERFSFAGEKAQTANRSALEQARQMEREGADSEAIRQKTGWHKGYDGKWRFEIDDSGVKIKDSILIAGTLEDLIDHGMLFEAYPQLKNIRYQFEHIQNGAKGYIFRDNSGIILDSTLRAEALNGNKDKLKKVLIHEIQHYIQHNERFAGGTNPKEEKQRGGMVVFENEQKAYSELLTAVKQQYDNDSSTEEDWETADTLDEIIRSIKELDPQSPDFSFVTSKSMIDVIRASDSDAVIEAFQNWISARYDAGLYERSPDLWASNRYLNSAGEIEARDSESRINLSEAQRKEKRPDIDRDDVVFADGGVSFSVDEPYNQYSLKRIERFIAEGAKYKDLSMREFIDKTEEYGYGALPFLSIGREHPDFKPEIKTYYRIGEPRLSPDGTYKSSYNYADDKPEEGISVVTSEWLHSMKSVFFGVSNEDLKRRGVYKITGFELPSKGGDNEKLIIPMDWAVKTRITTKRGLEKAVADAEKDNVGAAVPKSPNGRYSKDDTIFDDFEDEEVMFTADGDIAFDGFGADAQRTIDVKEMVQEQGAEHAVYTLYNAAARTAEKAIKGHSGIQLGEQNYERIAKKLMRQFGISGKHSPEMQAVIADRVKAFADAVKQKKKADFDVLLNALATDCKRYLEQSGEYTRGAMQEDASKLYSTLKNATLILTPYAEKEVLDSFDGDIHQLRRRLRGYVHVGFEKDIARYKHPIYIDDVIDTFAQETGDGYEGISPYFPDGVRPDSLEGWKWLVDMLDLFQPKFVSRFESGEYYQSMDAAAVDMALAAGTAIADEMGQQAAVLRKIDKNAVREIAEDRKKAISTLSALNKAKQLQAGEKLDRMRKRWQQEHMKRELAEENLSVLKSFVASDTKNYRAQYREQQRKAQYIRHLGRKLDSLTKRLDGKAAKNEYIPETLKKPILSVLELFDVSRPGTETPGYFGAFRQLDEVGARVNALALAYEKLKDSDHRNDKYENLGFDINALAYRDSVLTELRFLGELAEGKNVYQMTADDLQSVVEVMEELDRQLKSAVEMILDGKRVTIQEAADSCIGQTADVRFFKDGKNLLTDTLRAAKNKFVATSLDPVRYGRLLSGYHDDGVMYQLLRTLHQGEQKKILLMQRAYSVLQDITAKYSRKELQAVQRDAVEEFTMKDRRTGADVKLSQGLLLSIYLTDRQADGHRHLDNEKYSRYTVVPDLDYMNRNRVLPDTKGNRQRALGDKRHEVVFDRYTLQKIADYVKDTPLLRELADGMTQVFDGFLADEINKVSMEREGRMIATVQNYFPIRTDSDDPNKKYQVNNEGEGIFVDERLKSRSFTKQRVFSYNAIVMEDALEVFQRHVDATAEYCGMLIPVENIKKVLNSDNGEITVRRQLELKFGSDALHYLDKLLGDIQKRKDGTDENWFTRASGRAMGAALALNPRSTLKNWAAMPLANRYFGRANVSKAVVMGFVKGKDLVQKYDAYTPYMWYRAQGNGTVVGELSRRHGLYERFGERLDIMSWADQKVVNSLLYAAEAHVKQTTELEADSEEFKKEVARQFEQCVDESQPNSMLTSKPQFVRNNVMRALSLNAFASQRMAMGNGVIDSYLEYAARRSEYKQDKTDAAKKAMRDAHKQFLRSVAGVVESAVLQSLLGVLATMLIYHKWDDYKDENGEVTFASVASGVGLGVLKGLPEEIAGGFVWLDKACAAAEKLVDKDAYGAEFGAMSITAVTDMAEYIQGGKWDKVLGKAADLLGVPLLGGSNVQRLFGSAKGYLFDVLNGRLGYIDNSGKVDLSYMDVLIAEEFRKGNGKQAVWLRGVWETELESRGKSTATIDEKLAKALANGNEDIRNAAVAQVNGSFKAHKAARDKYVGLGMDGAVFDKAVTKVINGMEKEVKDQGFETAIEATEYLKELGYQDAAAEKTAKKLLYPEDKPKAGGRYQLSDAFKAVVGGDEESLAVVKKDLLENGKTEEDIEKYLKSFSQTKELFEDYYANSGERFHRARKILERIYGDELAAKYADFKKRYKDGR